MKKILLIVLTLPMIANCFAQSEPEAVDTKGMIDKIDRSDIESEGMEIDPSLMKMEMPIIEFDENIDTIKPVKSTNESHAGHAHANKTHKESSPPVKKEASAAVTSSATITTAGKPKVKKEAEVKKTATTANSQTKKRKVLIAKRPISLKTLKNNDKIVINKGLTYIYRLSKSNIIQYKYKGKLPLDSKGLKKHSESSYYIINNALFIADAEAFSGKKTKKSKKSKPRTTTNKRKTSSKAKKKTAVVQKKVQDIDTTITAEILSKRKEVEASYNYGKEIKKSILLKGLRVNDMIYVIGDVQLVLRKNKSTSGVKKFWLTEKINPENKSLESKGKNKYKVIRLYQEK